MFTSTERDAQRAKASAFLALHRGTKPLVLANSWDVASSRIVEAAGFPAVATSSAEIAWSLGYPDGERVPRKPRKCLPPDPPPVVS